MVEIPAFVIEFTLAPIRITPNQGYCTSENALMLAILCAPERMATVQRMEPGQFSGRHTDQRRSLCFIVILGRKSVGFIPLPELLARFFSVSIMAGGMR